MTTRWHSNADIFSIDDANLISARRHAVDLDLPTLWYTLLGTNGPPPLPGEPVRYDLLRRTELLKNRLTSVIVHAWPRPQDPVVQALRQEAIDMVRELDQLRARILR
jgi:hypothetical protein